MNLAVRQSFEHVFVIVFAVSRGWLPGFLRLVEERLLLRRLAIADRFVINQKLLVCVAVLLKVFAVIERLASTVFTSGNVVLMLAVIITFVVRVEWA